MGPADGGQFARSVLLLSRRVADYAPAEIRQNHHHSFRHRIRRRAGESKAATIGFTRTLAREVGDDNINVNCLAPGNTLSEENPTAQMVKFRESSVGLRSLKRIQMPQDVVGAMLFLASPLSDFITGQTVNVDGGISFL